MKINNRMKPSNLEMFALNILLFICCGVFQTGFKTGSASNIRFPVIEDFPEKCNFSDGTEGICRNSQNCPASLTAQTVQTCYFLQSEHYVCCPENIWTIRTERPIFTICPASNNVFAIVHGQPTYYKEYPYMVALGWDNFLESNTYDYKCGGALISNRYVLTAAHCTKLNGVEPSVALIGGVNLSDTSLRPIKIEKIIRHPDYKSNQVYHDIALIKLAESSTETNVCLWTVFPLDNVNVTAIGYGDTTFGGLSSTSLLKAQLMIISNDLCNKSYINESTLSHGIAQTQICAYDPKQLSDTCQGDSGGPIILRSNDINTPYVVGITSFGKGCALDTPGIYTRVSEYIDWIENILFPL